MVQAHIVGELEVRTPAPNLRQTRIQCRATAAHASPRTTKLYDRTSDVLTLEEIEKIGI